MSTGRHAIELFQLVFIRALVTKGEDKSLFALKGGCNLRFYFQSVRYSEDIDFDVAVIARETLKNKVERLLRSPPVVMPLKARGVELIDSSAVKQTDTTQRWKVGLRVDGNEVPLRMKIEFSRRNAVRDVAFEAIDRRVLQPYALMPVLASHYTAQAAIAQKIDALASRAQPQARDVFDLALLFARPEAGTYGAHEGQARLTAEAIERAMGISFDEYRSQVVAYLEPGQAELYASRSAWEAMQDAVVRGLEAGK